MPQTLVPRLCRGFLHLTQYLTVIYHPDIGSPFFPAYCRVTTFSGEEKGNK
jgi:hypothetical protein